MSTTIIPIRRRSYENIHTNEHSFHEPSYRCECGQNFVNERNRNLHQQTNCPSFNIKCSFCSERFSNTENIRRHLVSCGTKTDPCPVCQKYIQRSHFAYHYENNCANLPNANESQQLSKPNVPPRAIVNQNRPLIRVDVPPVPTDETGAQRETRFHGENPNSTLTRLNMNRRQPSVPTSSLKNPSNENPQYFPCEICHESIHVRDWSSHGTKCLEKDDRRIKERAREISRERIREEIPCEFCQRNFVGKEVVKHQRECPNNPENNRAQPTRTILRQQRSIEPDSRAQYQTIDVDRTRAANGLNADQRDHFDRQIPIRRNSDDTGLNRIQLIEQNEYDDRNRQSQVYRNGKADRGQFHHSQDLMQDRSHQLKQKSSWKKFFCGLTGS